MLTLYFLGEGGCLLMKCKYVATTEIVYVSRVTELVLSKTHDSTSVSLLCRASNPGSRSGKWYLYRPQLYAL
jgi:hypothetical protein